MIYGPGMGENVISMAFTSDCSYLTGSWRYLKGGSCVLCPYFYEKQQHRQRASEVGSRAYLLVA